MFASVVCVGVFGGAGAALVPPSWCALPGCGSWCLPWCPLPPCLGPRSRPFLVLGWFPAPMWCRFRRPVPGSACPHLGPFRALFPECSLVPLALPLPLSCPFLVWWWREGRGGEGAPAAQAWGWVAWSHRVGRWAVVVVGVVLVVVVVGPLVVVVWVVVGLVLRVWPMDPLWVFRSPLWGGGVGHRGHSPGLHYVVGRGGGLGAGLDGGGGRGVPRPWVGLAGGGGGLWGMDDGALGDGDADEGLDGVVLGGRLCGGGGCQREGGAGCGGWGVLAWARVRAGVVSGGFVSLRLWCCVCSRGRRLGFGVGFGVGVRFQVEEHLLGGVRAPMSGRGSSRCVAGVPESPVWGLGGRCVRLRLWLSPWP